MKKIIFSALCALPLVVSLTSCGKKKDEPNQPSTPEAVTKTVTIDASKYETWQYFSFSKGEVVNVTDYKNDLNWDMALHRYDVRLNCGESGKGKGGAVFSGKTEMDQATSVPTDGYTVDVLGRITVKYEMGPDGHQMEYESPIIFLYEPVPPKTTELSFSDKSASPKFTDRKCSDCGASFREKRRENFFAVA